MPNTPKPPAPKPEEATPSAHVGCLGSGWPLLIGWAITAGFYFMLIATPVALFILVLYRLFQMIRGG